MKDEAEAGKRSGLKYSSLSLLVFWPHCSLACISKGTACGLLNRVHTPGYSRLQSDRDDQMGAKIETQKNPIPNLRASKIYNSWNPDYLPSHPSPPPGIHTHLHRSPKREEWIKVKSLKSKYEVYCNFQRCVEVKPGNKIVHGGGSMDIFATVSDTELFRGVYKPDSTITWSFYLR